MRDLIIVAHPDDEVLGCGGTIARSSRKGREIFIAILGEGITSRYEKREDADEGAIESLRKKALRAADILGARDVFFYDLPDNRFDTVPLLDIVKTVETLLEQLRPEKVYTHHAGDLNVDHAVAHRAVLTATRPVARAFVKEVLSFEIPSSTEWAFGQMQPQFHPNVFVDITHTIDTKTEAVSVYDSEARSFPHPRSSKALRALARYRGATAGFQAAEAFELVRCLR